MILTQFLRPGGTRFRLKTIIAYFAVYSMFIILGLQGRFLARNVPFLRDSWIMVQIFIALLVIATLIEILLNFFFWRNQVPTYTLYLGPALMIGYILDKPLCFITPFFRNSGALFGFCFQSQFWLWLFCRFVLISGLLMFAFVFLENLRVKK